MSVRDQIDDLRSQHKARLDELRRLSSERRNQRDAMADQFADLRKQHDERMDQLKDQTREWQERRARYRKGKVAAGAFLRKQLSWVGERTIHTMSPFFFCFCCVVLAQLARPQALTGLQRRSWKTPPRRHAWSSFVQLASTRSQGARSWQKTSLPCKAWLFVKRPTWACPCPCPTQSLTLTYTCAQRGGGL